MKNLKLSLTYLLLFGISVNLDAQWIELGGNNSLKAGEYIWDLKADTKGNIYAAGDFMNAKGRNYVAKFDGKKWIDLQGGSTLGAHDRIHVVATDSKGNVYAGGSFENNSRRKYVAKFDTTWNELGGYNSLDANGPIETIIADKLGNVYVGGQFKNSNGYSYIAKFDGTNWTELGGQNSFEQDQVSQNSPTEIRFDSKGNIYVSGLLMDFSNQFCIKKYNGSVWSHILIDSTIICCTPSEMVLDSKDNIYIPGGVKNNYGKYNVVKYDGTKWTELGGANSLISDGPISSLYCDKKDNIYATGFFTNSKGRYSIAKFDGVKWSAVGGSYFAERGDGITSFCLNAQDQIVVGGGFKNDSDNRYVALLTCNNAVKEVSAILPDKASYTFGTKSLTQPGIYYDTFISAYGCDSIVKLTLKTSSGSSSTRDQNQTHIQIYPNPVSSQLYIDKGVSTASYQIAIYSLDGKQVYFGLNPGTIDVSRLDRGVYILEYASENECSKRKIQLE